MTAANEKSRYTPVSPMLFLMSSRAFFSSTWTASVWPCLAEMCSAVSPAEFWLSMSVSVRKVCYGQSNIDKSHTKCLYECFY